MNPARLINIATQLALSGTLRIIDSPMGKPPSHTGKKYPTADLLPSQKTKEVEYATQQRRVRQQIQH